MEFEVLNEIMTGTVAQLFTGAQNHASMHKSSSQMGQDKSEIPRKSSFSEQSPDFDPVTTVSLGGAAAATDSPLSNWLKVEAKLKYQAACQKLGIDNQKIQGKHLSTFSMEDLMREKKKVKTELKIYDQSFQSKFKRAPSRVEKEPMRNLYMYYKRLKQSISRKQARGGDSAGSNDRTAAAHGGASSSELGSAPGSRVGSQASRGSAQSGVSLASGLTDNSGAARADGLAGRRGSAGATGNEEIKLDGGPGRLTAENLASLGGEHADDLDEMRRKYAIQTLVDAQKKLAFIKSERKELRTKLDLFQKNFEAVHNRKIRYTKDIVAVQSEFKRYKDLKVDVANIEKGMRYLPKN